MSQITVSPAANAWSSTAHSAWRSGLLPRYFKYTPSPYVDGGATSAGGAAPPPALSSAAGSSAEGDGWSLPTIASRSDLDRHG